MKEVKESNTFDCTLYKGGINKYIITIQPKSAKRTINQENLQNDPLTKQFIEMLIRDILHSNPNLIFYKDLFVLNSDPKIIESKYGDSMTLYPGYTTSFMETEGGNYINVTFKNKILSSEDILSIINKKFKKQNKYDKDEIKKFLINKKFQVSYSKKNYIINEINFDRNPNTQTCKYEDRTVKLVEYYKERYNKEIKDLTQPLIVVKKKMLIYILFQNFDIFLN